MNSSISERQILQFILKINEEIDNLKNEFGKMKGDIRILYNLYENVFKHGFPDDYFSQNKAVLVEIYYKKIDVLNLVIIKIHDNGQGLPKSEEFSFGEGLNSVNLVGQFILRNINVNKSNKSNYSTFSYFEMYNFTEFYHSLRGC